MSDAPVEPGASQPIETPEHDHGEAAVAAESPATDPRRPVLNPGLSGEPMTLEAMAERVQQAHPDVSTTIQHGELTVHVAPERLHDLLAWARDDAELQLRMLADLGAVHWPAGEHVIERQPSTTGWPEYRVSRESGVIEVLYVLRSWARNHWLRVSVGVDDEAPSLPTATDVYPAANFHEREAYDFFGIDFVGHPGLNRILMPEDWVGYPGRKDYPLGGIDIPYENDKFIPPPQRRDLREIVGGEG